MYFSLILTTLSRKVRQKVFASTEYLNQDICL